MRRILSVLILLVMSVAACVPPYNLSAPPAITQSPSHSITQSPNHSITQSPAPPITPSPDPYFAWSIDFLRSRAYGGGQIEFLGVLGQGPGFTRYQIRYPSDGLHIYGFANIPDEGGPHPVIIALHGYIDPAVYNTLDYTTRYADGLANAGYIVLHPNLRGYPPSDSGENLFRVGMAIDVLNLIALVQAQSGQAGPLQTAEPDRIGLWGHSMGGGISTRVLTVTEAVKAAVLYAPMSGDEEKNYAAIRQWSGQTRGLDELHVPAGALDRISPMYFFGNIQAAVSIHHGTADALVPMDWSVTTCDQLTALGKNVQCSYYKDMPHTFTGPGDQEFMQNVVRFFDQTLKTH